MKHLLLIAVIMLSGCAITPEQNLAIKKAALGYKPYDPCIRCGEQWQHLPNWDNEAIIRKQRGETW